MIVVAGRTRRCNPGDELRRSVKRDTQSRLQNRNVPEVTEFAAVIEVVSVKQPRCSRGGGDHKQREDRQQRRHSNRKLC